MNLIVQHPADAVTVCMREGAELRRRSYLLTAIDLWNSARPVIADEQ